MFTAGLAADILFYSFSEWILYASNAHIEKLGMEEWAKFIRYSIGVLYHGVSILS